jgi:hypothetical protein
MARQLADKLALSLWDGTVEESGRLAFVGDPARTFILAPPGRVWLPTGRAAESHPVEALIAGRKNAGVELEDSRYRIRSIRSPAGGSPEPSDDGAKKLAGERRPLSRAVATKMPSRKKQSDTTERLRVDSPACGEAGRDPVLRWVASTFGDEPPARTVRLRMPRRGSPGLALDRTLQVVDLRTVASLTRLVSGSRLGALRSLAVSPRRRRGSDWRPTAGCGGAHTKGAAMRTRGWLRGVFALGVMLVASMTLTAVGAAGTDFHPGSSGLGDPYFPLDGNGGYDVKHYFLDLKYHPDSDVLEGTATISAVATQNLSRFNLDFVGLTIDRLNVNGSAAARTRNGQELIVTPNRGLPKGDKFTVVVRYHGVPEVIEDELGTAGFIPTEDGAVVAGEPHVAATWFPANDHPLDKAAYTFRVKVPAGLKVVANGILRDTSTSKGWTTWRWEAKEPMASYLATATIGKFNINSYRHAGMPFWDAIDPALFVVPKPRTGKQYAISQKGDPSFKRLARNISVPANGATLSFWITRDTESDWDFVFVEAANAGANDWTTLRDLNGHTSRSTGQSCPFWHELHPFLRHYQTDNGDGTCSPQGSTGKWLAASGSSDGWEHWKVDLSAFAGSTARVSISYASDDLVQYAGAFVDDIVVSTGQGTTSFEDDGNTRDGWTVPGAPPSSEPNPNDWLVGTQADAPAPLGSDIHASFSREGEIIDFLSGEFGPYPFSTAGGIADDVDLGFALENQTRPVYSPIFWTIPGQGDIVVVHELAHMWYGDSLSVAAWKHIWLNEGFATYAEWLWSEHEGLGTAQENFDGLYNAIPEDDPFWSVIVGNPGREHLFDFAIYGRGAMTLHQLRLAVGDADFFEILRRWARSHAGGNVKTGQFIALAERVSGKDLDKLFDIWLFTPGKPDVPAAKVSRSAATTQLGAAGRLITRLGLRR